MRVLSFVEIGLAAIGCMLWLAGCSTPSLLTYPVEKAPDSADLKKQQALPPIVHVNQDNCNYQMTYTVQPGDNIYVIAWAFERDDQELIRINGLQPPYDLKVGEKILLQANRSKPDAASKNADAPDRRVSEEAKSSQLQSRQQVVESKTYYYRSDRYRGEMEKSGAQTAELRSKERMGSLSSAAVRLPRKNSSYWGWPVEGTVSKKFGQTKMQRGMELHGVYGQEIYAACDGTVVYSGNSVNYFDNLIIIKHNRQLMSAYGYNARNLVHVGDKVVRGQKIAVMGHHHNRPTLYFEVRKQGKPIDPATILPLRAVGVQKSDGRS